jgi:hypothetical protein
MTQVPRSSPVRPVTQLVLRVAVGALVLCLSAVTGWSIEVPPAAAAGCGPAPQGQVAVVMVIDRGNGTPSTRCAIVAQGSTGLDALRAAGHDVRLDGGFVCGIDGLPATGCGNRPDAGFAYWRYFHAAPGAAWSYSQVGAGGYRLPARCAVEGWVWSDSPSSNTPPSLPAPTPTCEAPPTTVAPTVPAGPGASPSTPAPAAPAGGPQIATPPGAPSGAGAATGGGPTAPGAPSASVAADTTVPLDSAGVPVDGAAVEDPATGPADVTTSVDPDDSDEGAAAGTGDAESVGELAASADGGSSGGAPWGVLVAVALVAALGGAAAWRTRRRAADTATA